LRGRVRTETKTYVLSCSHRELRRCAARWLPWMRWRSSAQRGLTWRTIHSSIQHFGSDGHVEQQGFVRNSIMRVI
jgi:hypothetical protein